MQNFFNSLPTARTTLNYEEIFLRMRVDQKILSLTQQEKQDSFTPFFNIIPADFNVLGLLNILLCKNVAYCSSKKFTTAHMPLTLFTNYNHLWFDLSLGDCKMYDKARFGVWGGVATRTWAVGTTASFWSGCTSTQSFSPAFQIDWFTCLNSHA